MLLRNAEPADLPEGALDSAEQYLQAIQTCPPKKPEYPPEVVQRRKELEQKPDKFLSVRPGVGTGIAPAYGT